MANEAICYEKPTKFARYTVADGVGITKGTILKLSTPNTASASDGDNNVFAGIAYMEKVANDGTTEISAALDGVWGLTAVGSITVGNMLSMNGSNTVKIYTTLDGEVGYGFGKALQTTVGGEVIKVRLNE